MDIIARLEEEVASQTKVVDKLKSKHEGTIDDLAKDESTKKKIFESLVSKCSFSVKEMGRLKKENDTARKTLATLKKSVETAHKSVMEIQEKFDLDCPKPVDLDPQMLERFGKNHLQVNSFFVWVTNL